VNTRPQRRPDPSAARRHPLDAGRAAQPSHHRNLPDAGPESRARYGAGLLRGVWLSLSFPLLAVSAVDDGLNHCQRICAVLGEHARPGEPVATISADATDREVCSDSMRDDARHGGVGFGQHCDERPVVQGAHTITEPELGAHRLDSKRSLAGAQGLAGDPLRDHAEHDERAAITVGAEDLLFEPVEDVLLLQLRTVERHEAIPERRRARSADRGLGDGDVLDLRKPRRSRRRTVQEREAAERLPMGV